MSKRRCFTYTIALALLGTFFVTGSVLSLAKEVVVDNSSAGTSSTGTWLVSGGPNPYGANSLYGNNGATYTWHAALPESGTYDVYMWWTYYNNRSANAPVTIGYSGGSQVIRVNQLINGGQWNKLGSFRFDAAEGGTITLTAEGAAPTTYSADAVRFVSVPAPNAGDAVVDNSSAGTSSTGTWLVSGGLTPYGTNSLYANGSSTSAPTYTWKAALPQSGTYDVYMWWTYYSNRSANAPVDIIHGNGSTRVWVNQLDQTKAGMWNKLGTFVFDATLGGTVKLTANTAGFTYSADAVRFVYVATPSNAVPAASIDSITPSPAAVGQTVSFTGHGTDGDGTITGYSWRSSIDGQLSTAASFSTARLSEGSHTIYLKVQDNAGAWSPETSRSLTVKEAGGEAPTFGFVDDFISNSTGEYTVAVTKAESSQAIVPRGGFTYELPNRRVKVSAAENTRVLFSHPLSSQVNGVFLLDFLPTYKHPTPLVPGGRLLIRLKQDQDNYYELYSSNGAGAGYLRKIVNGQQAAYTAFRTGYLLNTKIYTIKITYAADTAKVEAFDQVLTISAGGIILVNSFEVEAVQQDAYIDNIVSPHTADPYVFITTPRNYYLKRDAPLVVKGLSGNVQAGWGTRFVLDRDTASEIMLTDMTAPYEVSFGSVAPGEHTMDAFVVDASGNVVPGNFTHDSQSAVGIGEYMVAIGDSITYGEGDDYGPDNTSNDERNTGGGYEPILNNLLTGYRGYPHTVVNEGASGTRTVNGAVSVPGIIAQHPNAGYYLVMYGTNDSRVKTPSGLGLRPGDTGYYGSYKDFMQRIITSIKNAGKIPVLAKIPPVLGDTATGAPYPDLNSAARNVLIRDYNKVIDELVVENSLPLRGPDFYQYFAGHTEEYFDNYHPNGRGYQSMAHLWFNALIP
ncbi:MAG: GDSL-type esterase/lipase family protein [Nitrospirota bacterium]